VASRLLIHPVPRRNAAALATAQSQLTELKTLAGHAVELLSSPPVGVEAVDQRQARVREYAEAQARSIGLFLDILDMLAADTIPNEATWTAWGDSKRAADKLWEQIWTRK
jgi:hypothetical protein